MVHTRPRNHGERGAVPVSDSGALRISTLAIRELRSFQIAPSSTKWCRLTKVAITSNRPPARPGPLRKPLGSISTAGSVQIAIPETAAFAQ